MFELTWLVLDFLVAIIFFLASIVLIPLIAKWFGLKIIFKIEQFSKKELITMLEDEIKIKEANSKLLKGV